MWTGCMPEVYPIYFNPLCTWKKKYYCCAETDQSELQNSVNFTPELMLFIYQLRNINHHFEMMHAAWFTFTLNVSTARGVICLWGKWSMNGKQWQVSTDWSHRNIWDLNRPQCHVDVYWINWIVQCPECCVGLSGKADMTLRKKKKEEERLVAMSKRWTSVTLGHRATDYWSFILLRWY